jgi:hypothetical protein
LAQPGGDASVRRRVGARADLSSQCGALPAPFLDHGACLIYQGFVPYHGRELLLELARISPFGARCARTIVLIPFRIMLNLRARRQREPHLLYTLTPNGRPTSIR